MRPDTTSREPEACGDPVIRLDHVHKQFGPHVVFEDLTLEIQRGRTTVVLGQSGVGKSVMLKFITGLLRPDRGRVIVCGQDVTNLTERQFIPVRMRFGVVFQGAALFDYLSVYENVAFALREHKRLPESEVREIVRRRLELVDMAGTEALLPEELSGGMKKRVGLARAIAMDPHCILYDEPTAGLDPVTADMINRLILRCQKELKATSIVVTHDMASAYRVGDRILMLYEGQIIADGTPDEFRACPDVRVQRFIRGDAGYDGNGGSKEVQGSKFKVQG